MIKNLLIVGLGGGIGSIARYLFQRWVVYHWQPHYFWGTFGINAAGCFLIGIFWGIHFRSFASNENWKLFLMTGLCGGFTTFSAFTLEAIGLLKEQRLGMFFLYIAASILVCLAATYAGMRFFR